MRIIKWLATGFEKKQPSVDIDLISSRCFNGLTVRWLYNLWFNLVFHFFHRLSHFASFYLAIKQYILQCLSHVCRPGVSFSLRSVLIFGGGGDGRGAQMEWMCLGPGLQYVQMSAFTFLTYFHNTSRAFLFCQIQQWKIVRLCLYESSFFYWGICWFQSQ